MRHALLAAVVLAVAAAAVGIYRGWAPTSLPALKTPAPPAVLVVIPLIPQQVDTVADLLQIAWRRSPPCDNSNQTRPSTVVFYSSQTLDDSGRAKLRSAFARVPRGACFHPRPQFIAANVPSNLDTYPRGASEMFFALTSESQRVTWQPEKWPFVLYLEPDVVPCRGGWLARMQREAAFTLAMGPVWIRGSLLRYDTAVVAAAADTAASSSAVAEQAERAYEYGRDAPHRLHINGNALYHVADAGFRAFIQQRVRPALESGDYSHSYDMVIDAVLRRLPWPVFTDYAHLFQLSASIVNFYYWTSPAVNGTAFCSLSPAVLLHGKHIVF